jgi:hypothetical protein
MADSREQGLSGADGLPDPQRAPGPPASSPGLAGPSQLASSPGLADPSQLVAHREVLEGIRQLHGRMSELERALVAGNHGVIPEVRKFVPAWRRKTRGEPRWHVVLAITVAILLQGPLPGRLVLFQPTWLLPMLEGVVFVLITVLNPHRIDRESKVLRILSLSGATLISLANAWSAAHLVNGLIQGTEGSSAGPLLGSGAVIWLTNVIVFGLWYWEFDRGGPVARAHATKLYPDFMFPQMTSPDLAPADWEPMFGDYLYVSFTNATAFSPTDVMPLSRWAKAAMAVQAGISVITVALVVARAVNILK